MIFKVFFKCLYGLENTSDTGIISGLGYEAQVIEMPPHNNPNYVSDHVSWTRGSRRIPAKIRQSRSAGMDSPQKFSKSSRIAPHF